MSALEEIGKGLRGPNTLSFLYCTGIVHFWRAKCYYGCRCLCGQVFSSEPQTVYSHHVIFRMDENTTENSWNRAEEEYLQKRGYVKRSEYEKTFIFDPITGIELQRATRGPADRCD